MKLKIILGSIAIVTILVFLAMNFLESKIEYGTITMAKEKGKLIQIKGACVQEKESFYDSKNNQFIFYMKDDEGQETKVIYDGAKPNNFELAEAVVVKGRYSEGVFHAKDILTKCPSKYEGNSEQIKKTL
ncbi:MAG: cytochrome c maturation protein CcmE [Ignavibacteria bacterium]|nr:cytochrome c maturation protein CcmE [Ignavibacteria bacterium]